MKNIRLPRKDTRRLHLEMIIVRINVTKKIKVKENYTRHLVENIVRTYHQTMVFK